MSVNEPPDSGPDITICPAEGCESTEDLMIQECAPGHSWMYTGGACGHVAFIAKKHDEQESESTK